MRKQLRGRVGSCKPVLNGDRDNGDGSLVATDPGHPRDTMKLAADLGNDAEVSNGRACRTALPKSEREEAGIYVVVNACDQ